MLLRTKPPEFQIIVSFPVTWGTGETLYISESFIYFIKFYWRNLPSESNLRISTVCLVSIALSPDILNHHAGQHKSCTAIVVYGWMVNYLWKCDFSSNDPAVLNCLQQGPRQSNVSPYSPWCPWEPSQSSTFQKGHIFPLSPAMWEQENRPWVATSETSAKPHVAVWSWEEVLDLPSLWLKKQCKPGMEFPQTLRCLFQQ